MDEANFKRLSPTYFNWSILDYIVPFIKAIYEFFQIIKGMQIEFLAELSFAFIA